MRNTFATAFILLLLLSPLVPTNSAVADCECGDVLVPDRSSFQSNDYLALAFLKTLDEKGFDAFKRTIDSGGQIIYAGIPISGHMDYAQLQTAIHSREEILNINLTTSHSESLVTSNLSSNAINAWLKCQAGCRNGYSIAVKRITNNGIDILIHWSGETGVGDPLVYSATANGEPILLDGKQEGEVPILADNIHHFLRGDDTKDVTFIFSAKTKTLNIPKGAQDVVVRSKLPPPPPPPPMLECDFSPLDQQSWSSAPYSGVSGTVNLVKICSGLPKNSKVTAHFKGKLHTSPSDKPSFGFHLCLKDGLDPPSDGNCNGNPGGTSFGQHVNSAEVNLTTTAMTTVTGTVQVYVLGWDCGCQIISDPGSTLSVTAIQQ